MSRASPIEELAHVDVPPFNHNITIRNPQWLMYRSIVPDKTCDAIVELALKLPATQGTIFNSSRVNDPGRVSTAIRQSQVRWVNRNDPQFAKLLAFTDKVVRTVNQGFQVNCDTVNSLQFTEYPVGGYYNWHHDINWNRNDGRARKISFVIQLSAPDQYTGGDLEFKDHENPVREHLREKGTMICFMPYQMHRVTPLESGTRYSLVGWYEGPKWA